METVKRLRLIATILTWRWSSPWIGLRWISKNQGFTHCLWLLFKCFLALKAQTSRGSGETAQTSSSWRETLRIRCFVRNENTRRVLVDGDTAVACRTYREHLPLISSRFILPFFFRSFPLSLFLALFFFFFFLIFFLLFILLPSSFVPSLTHFLVSH